MCRSDNCVSIYTSNELNKINNVTMNTGIHTFHIPAIFPWTNMPATFINKLQHLFSRQYVSMYTSYEPNKINNVTRNTGIHTFHIPYIFPWTNMLAILQQLSINCNIYLAYYCKVCFGSKYVPEMPHIPNTSCADTRQLCQYINLIWTHCNQCHHKQWYAYFSYYWHMPLNKYLPATYHMYFPLQY